MRPPGRLAGRLAGRLTDRLTLSWVGLVVVTMVCVASMLTFVLHVPLTGASPEVTVSLPRTGGLFEGSQVTYRGVRVGTVTDVGFGDGGGVQATVALRPGAEVPTASRAAVRSLSPVGEQFLDFQPRSPEGPFLQDGDHVSAQARDLPVSLAQSAASLTDLLDAVDRRDVRVVLRELGDAVGGTEDELDHLLSSTNRLVTDLDRAWPQTERLLRNGETVGELLAAKRGELILFARAARILSAWLRDFDPSFRRILARAPEDFRTLTSFVGELEVVLPPFLRALIEFTDIGYEREPHLRRLTQVLEYGTGRFARAFSGGWLHIDLTFQGQRTCSYGVEPRDPMSTERKPLHRDGHCGMHDPVRRGAEHAPPPLAGR
jgi:phospholipid/cholesterol/gamma-HCH transport system substrate-binding protein